MLNANLVNSNQIYDVFSSIKSKIQYLGLFVSQVRILDFFVQADLMMLWMMETLLV